MNDLTALVAALQSNLSAVVAEARKAEAKAANLPEVEADVAAMLDALAVAEQDCSDHFKKFPREGFENRYESDPECRADWSRVHDARDKAVRALTRFAVARFEAASVAKAA